ncbi:hypothetical protein BDN67DRAFT_511951 [Paxillus ammoniavirescens]|nr:hypothetical protein BDN67DRAFT_511951 [Paxillus ammoniavirescens]
MNLGFAPHPVRSCEIWVLVTLFAFVFSSLCQHGTKRRDHEIRTGHGLALLTPRTSRLFLCYWKTYPR